MAGTPVPTWVLIGSYWLHMLATVVWIGGLSALALLVFPAASQSLSPAAFAELLDRLQRRLDPVGWFCLLLLAGTGLLQMSASPNYQGLLALDNRWASAIFIKHILFLAMTALSAYMTWGLLPRLRRLLLAARRQPEVDQVSTQRLIRQEIRLVQFNSLLGILVLLLTAAARAV